MTRTCALFFGKMYNKMASRLKVCTTEVSATTRFPPEPQPMTSHCLFFNVNRI